MTHSIAFGHITHTGCVRDHNEDAYIALPDLGLWLVADGMGGHEGGEVASAIVVDHVAEQVRNGAKLGDALASAHNAVITEAQAGRGKPDMGSTAVALQLNGNQYEIAWVGDSRAYLWNGNRLMQLTRDHSFVQQLLDQGIIDEEEALVHPDRNVISQSLGSTSAKLNVETIKGELYQNQRILLCSDGLTGEVSDDTITNILEQSLDVQVSAEALVNAAVSNGGHDNITVIIVDAPTSAILKPGPAKTQPIDTRAIDRYLKYGTPKRWFMYGSLVALLLAIIGGIVYLTINHSLTDSNVQGGGIITNPAPLAVNEPEHSITPAKETGVQPLPGLLTKRTELVESTENSETEAEVTEGKAPDVISISSD